MPTWWEVMDNTSISINISIATQQITANGVLWLAHGPGCKIIPTPMRVWSSRFVKKPLNFNRWDTLTGTSPTLWNTCSTKLIKMFGCACRQTNKFPVRFQRPSVLYLRMQNTEIVMGMDTNSQCAVIHSTHAGALCACYAMGPMSYQTIHTHARSPKTQLR